MAKQTGLGDNLYVAGRDLSGDVGSLASIGGGPSPLEVTGIDKSAFERLGGERDGALDFTAFFNDAAGQAHPTLAALPTSDVIVSYFRGTALGGQAAALVGKQVNYDGARNEDGSLTFKVKAAANGYGLEWGRSLTPGKQTLSGGGNQASVDFGADAPGFFDAQAYLHVFAFTGVDATVKIQTSTDNGSLDPFSDRINFTQITSGPTSERKTQSTPGSQLMERYARITVATSGGFSNLVFAVMVNVNQMAVSF